MQILIHSLTHPHSLLWGVGRKAEHLKEAITNLGKYDELEQLHQTNYRVVRWQSYPLCQNVSPIPKTTYTVFVYAFIYSCAFQADSEIESKCWSRTILKYVDLAETPNQEAESKIQKQAETHQCRNRLSKARTTLRNKYWPKS